MFEHWAQNGQRSLDLIFDLCLADPACHTAFPNLSVEFTELLERLATQPVTGSFTGPNDPQPVQFTCDGFSNTEVSGDVPIGLAW